MRSERALFSLGEVAAAVGGVLERGLEDTPVSGVCHDSRRVAPGDLFVAVPGEHHDARGFAAEASVRGAAAILCAPGGPPLPVTLGVVRVEDPVAALWDLASFHRRTLGARVVAVTGTCGKTTTKEMVGLVLGAHRPTVRARASFNNHLGVPLTILSADRDTDFLVLEIGTSAPGEIARLCSLARPHWGLITHVGPAHLQGLDSTERVLEEKLALAESLPEAGLLFVPADAPWASQAAERARCPLVLVSVQELGARSGGEGDACGAGAEAAWGSTLAWGGVPVRVPVPGRPGMCAAGLALAVAQEAGVDPDRAAGALAAYQAPAGRLTGRWLGEVFLVDDTYNANPDSVTAALDVLAGLCGEGRRIAVLGPMAELGRESGRYHRVVGRRAAGSGLDLLVTVGTETLPTALEAARRGLRVIRTAGADAAAEALRAQLRPGDRVLVKGSRSAGLERVVRLVEEHLAGGSTGEEGRAVAGG